MTDPILEVRDLYAEYAEGSKRVRAVDGVSFSLRRGGILALVGESGCGTPTVALALMGLLLRPGQVAGGGVGVAAPSNIWGRACEDGRRLAADRAGASIRVEALD